MQPVWKDDILTFNVPLCLKTCEIILLNDDEVLGSFDMEIKEMLDQDEEKSFNEEFEDDKGVRVGSLKFQTLVGESPEFSEIKTLPRKKNKEEAKEEEGEKKE